MSHRRESVRIGHKQLEMNAEGAIWQLEKEEQGERATNGVKRMKAINSK